MENPKFDQTFMLWNLLDISQDRYNELEKWVMESLQPSVDKTAGKLAGDFINDFKKHGPAVMHKNMIQVAISSGELGMQSVAELLIAVEHEDQFSIIERLFIATQAIDIFSWMVKQQYFTKTNDFFNKQFPGMFPDFEL